MDYKSGDDATWEEIEADLDQMPIPKQVELFQRCVQEAKSRLFVAKLVADRVIGAFGADVVKKVEGEVFINVVENDLKTLQAMLVLDWSGHNSERERLELLHHIFCPQTRRDGGHAYSLNDHMFAYRRGLGFDFLSQGADGAQLKYWELLRDHLERNPDEPPGWRERVDEIKRDREAWKKEAASPGPR